MEERRVLVQERVPGVRVRSDEGVEGVEEGQHVVAREVHNYGELGASGWARIGVAIVVVDGIGRLVIVVGGVVGIVGWTVVVCVAIVVVVVIGLIVLSSSLLSPGTGYKGSRLQIHASTQPIVLAIA